MPTLTTLVNFNGTDGETPYGVLIAHAAGDLFGTVSDGSVFEIAKTTGGYASTPTILVNFNDYDGETPDRPRHGASHHLG